MIVPVLHRSAVASPRLRDGSVDGRDFAVARLWLGSKHPMQIHLWETHGPPDLFYFSLIS